MTDVHSSSVKQKSLVEGIEEKYSFEDNDEMLVEIFVPKSAPGRKDSGDIHVPQELVLENFAITNAGEESRINSLCKNVTLLDLSENAITDWSEIFKILDQLPKCAFLNLRANPLCNQLDGLKCSSTNYPKLEKLFLNDLYISWEIVTTVLELFPNLQELHLSRNKYLTVDIPEAKEFASMKSLYIQSNQLSSWQEVSKLGKAFPNLHNLVLLGNPIEGLPTAEEASATFPCLKCLNVGNTKISGWSEVEKLSNFPHLTDIKMQGLDFLDEYNDDLRRLLLLAYLPNITRLNGGTFSESEKIKAERAFVRHYMDKDDKPQRYHALEAKHGKIEPLAAVDLRIKKTSSVVVKYGSKSLSTVIENKWTVVELKKHLQTLIDLPANRMRVWHEESDGHVSSLEELLSSSLPVSRYNVEDGDELLVDEQAISSIKEALKS